MRTAQRSVGSNFPLLALLQWPLFFSMALSIILLSRRLSLRTRPINSVLLVFKILKKLTLQSVKKRSRSFCIVSGLFQAFARNTAFQTSKSLFSSVLLKAYDSLSCDATLQTQSCSRFLWNIYSNIYQYLKILDIWFILVIIPGHSKYLYSFWWARILFEFNFLRYDYVILFSHYKPSLLLYRPIFPSAGTHIHIHGYDSVRKTMHLTFCAVRYKSNILKRSSNGRNVCYDGRNHGFAFSNEMFLLEFPLQTGSSLINSV